MSAITKKKLVFCFDGTSNVLDAENPTNVVLTASGVAHYDKNGGQQLVYYDQGVGTAKGQALTGGAFGLGLYANVLEAYSFLIFNYEPGDEIYVFGFSRGAYTARSFVGFIRTAGVLQRRHADKIGRMRWLYQEGRNAPNADLELMGLRLDYGREICVDEVEDRFKCERLSGYSPGKHPLLNIQYVGVWDTVKTLGFLRTNKYAFHDDRLDSLVKSARHAISVDERRKKFDVTRWDNIDELNSNLGLKVDDPERPYQQMWFPGTHGGVGGGGDIRGLSDAALHWVWDGAKLAGLAFDVDEQSKIFKSRPDILAAVDNMSKEGKKKIKQKGFKDRVSAFLMNHLPKHWRKGPDFSHEVHETAVLRLAAPSGVLPNKKKYGPPTLKKVMKSLDERMLSYTADQFVYRPSQQSEYANGSEITINDKTFRVHTVNAADSRGLSGLAEKYLGHSNRYKEIYDLNRTIILDMNRIFIGQRILIPME